MLVYLLFIASILFVTLLVSIMFRAGQIHDQTQEQFRPGDVVLTNRGLHAGSRFVPHGQEIKLISRRASDWGWLWSALWTPSLGEDSIELHGIPENALSH